MSVSNTLQAAEQQHHHGNLVEAKRLYELQLQYVPNDADALHALGILLAQTKNYVDALKKIQAAIQSKPNQATFYNSLGNVLRQLNQLDEAHTAYQKAITINSDYAIAYNNLGNVYYQKAEFIAAKHAYEKAIALKNDYADAYANLGMLGNYYLLKQQFSEAIPLFLRIISNNPAYIEAQYHLGIAYFHLKEFVKAKKQFEIVLVLNYKHAEVNQYLANTLLEFRDHDKAMQYYFRQLEIGPQFETWYNLGVLFTMKDRLKEAILYFNQAILMNPNDLSTQLNLGNIYLKQNNRSDAIHCYEKYLAIKPNDPEVQHILSAIKNDNTSSSAPKEFVSHLFDQYAAYYEHHLTAGLKYTVPQKMLEIIQLENPLIKPASKIILDLGCGTGLCGVLLKPFAKKLIGVDLSENMLSVAREKKCYDELLLSDVADALKQYVEIDFIVAADVFTYIGDLRDIFMHAKKSLAKNGLFIFTVEKTFEKEFVLQRTIRYAHSKHYIESLSCDCQFEMVSLDTIVLREQKNQPVEGYLVLLRHLV